MQHVKTKRAARKGKRIGDGSELFGDWGVSNPNAAWTAYVMMDSTDWQHLPDGGGYFNQDEALITDIAMLSRMANYVEAQIEADESDPYGG